MTASLLLALATLPMVKQMVETDWPDAESAAAATAEVTLLGDEWHPADGSADGDEWNCLYGGGQIVEDRVRAWLNGAAHGFPNGRMKLRSGKNRLVVLTAGLGYKMLFPMMAIRSVRDDASVRWLKSSREEKTCRTLVQ